jgi:branched-subunit amino acid transport system permease
MLLMARAYRRNRAGRAVMAVRENQRAATSYSVNPARTKLGAFAVSGAMAAVAGVLLAYQNGAVDAGTYGIGRSLSVFVITVIGGLTSLPGAVFGAVLIEGIAFFGEDFVKNVFGESPAMAAVANNLTLLVTGPGLLLVLLVLPGGFAEAMYRTRDRYLRWVARRNDIHVPSLVADRRIETGEDQQEVITEAEHSVEEVESFEDLGERTIVCPVCNAELPIEMALEHEHLRAGAGAAAGRRSP